MQPHDGAIRKFRMDTRYTHHRSDGLTRRRNRGSQYVLDTVTRRGEHQVDREKGNP